MQVRRCTIIGVLRNDAVQAVSYEPFGAHESAYLAIDMQEQYTRKMGLWFRTRRSRIWRRTGRCSSRGYLLVAVALYFVFLGGAHPLRRGLKDTREVSTNALLCSKKDSMHRSRPCNTSYEKRFPIHTLPLSANQSVIRFWFGPTQSECAIRGEIRRAATSFTADHNASSIGT